MDYCGPRGIPYDVFISEWSPLSQQAALEWSIRERSRCSGCGSPAEDWDADRGGHRQAYHAEGYRCLGCEQLEMVKLGESEGKGMHKRLVPTMQLPMWGGPGWVSS